MEVVERLGHLREVLDDVVERQARFAFVVEQLLQVGAVDQFMTTTYAVPSSVNRSPRTIGSPGCGVMRHQQPRFGEQVVAVGVRDVDLQGDEPVVDGVECLDDRRAPADADGAQ